MKRLMIAAAMASAFTCAADSSYTYTAGDAGGNGVAITYDGDTTNIKTLTANTAGDTISISGDPITFAAGATITLASSGTVSFAQKVTTLGATTLARGDDVYKVWTGTAMTTADRTTPEFPDIRTNTTVTAADIANTWECIHVVGGAPNSSSAAGIASAGRYDRITGNIGGGSFVTLNRQHSAFIYSIRVQLSPKGDGLYARCRTGVRSPRFGLYPDLETRWATADLWDNSSGSTNIWGAGKVAMADRGIFGAGSGDATTYGGQWLNSTSAMGLNTVILKRKSAVGGPMKVRFDGGAELGGTTTIPFGMEAIVAVADGDDASTFSNTITGTGDFTLVPLAPSSDTVAVYMGDDFISTSWKVLARNRLLSSLTSLEGYLQGKSHTTCDKCEKVFYHYDPTNDTATCQFQKYRNSTSSKYVVAKLRQNGLNVEIAGVGYTYTEAGTGGASAYPAFGTVEFPMETVTKFEYKTMGWTTSVSTRVDPDGDYVSSNFTSGYGIRKITATFNAGCGVATISGDIKTLYGGKFTTAGTNGAKMLTSITSANGLPAAGEAHVSDGTLRLEATSAPGGGTTKIVVHSGGDVRNITSWQMGSSQELVLDGGTYYGLHDSIYLTYATFSNAVLKGTWSMRTAYQSGYQYWRIIGTEPTTVLDGGNYWINVYGYSNAVEAISGKCAFRVEVQDVTGDDEADFIIPAIRGAAGRGSDREKFTWFWFEKYGPGTIKVKNNSKELRMESKLYNGTLLLAGSDIMTNEVQLLGGNLAIEAGKANNNFGALTASKAGTITIGEGGSLGFASFAPDANLAKKSIMIDAPLRENALKFNTTLTGEQRRYFRWKDATAPNGSWRVAQDAAGYLHPVMQGTVLYLR